jgi:hypothetical protein
MLPWLSAAAWIALLAAMACALATLWRETRVDGSRARLVRILAAAAAVRVVIPWLPTHWYYSGGNIPQIGGAFQLRTTVVPWPDQLIAFDMHAGESGLIATHFVAGLAGIALLWGAVRRSGRAPLVRDVFGGLLAVIPAYARYSVTDSSHVWAWTCFASSTFALSARTSNDSSRWWDWILIVLAPVLGAPIRLESSILQFAAIFLARRTVFPIRWRSGQGWVFAAACVAGDGAAWVAHHEALSHRLHLDPLSIALGFLFRGVLMLPLPVLVSPYPPILALPIWYIAARRVRARDRAALLAMAVPAVFCAVPFLFGESISTEFGGAGYALLALTFPTLFAAEGIVAAREALSRWSSELGRLAVTSAAAVGALASFVPPWFRTYSFMEEHRFLRSALQDREGTVLALFDRDEMCGHDMDSSVALPDVLLSMESPGVHWTVLRADDADAIDVRELRFDYYYPGSEVSLDVASIDSTYGRLVDQSPSSRACQRDRLESLRRLDARIRGSIPLAVVEEKSVEARTFSFVAFPDDRATFVFYRRLSEGQ